MTPTAARWTLASVAAAGYCWSQACVNLLGWNRRWTTSMMLDAVACRQPILAGLVCMAALALTCDAFKEDAEWPWVLAICMVWVCIGHVFWNLER